MESQRQGRGKKSIGASLIYGATYHGATYDVVDDFDRTTRDHDDGGALYGNHIHDDHHYDGATLYGDHDYHYLHYDYDDHDYYDGGALYGNHDYHYLDHDNYDDCAGGGGGARGAVWFVWGW